MSNDKIKKQKIFLNAMDSWFSNFIIEYFRTDHMPESRYQTEFMGTINTPDEIHLPAHFNPSIYKFDFNPSYRNELFNNDIIIYDLNTGNLKEADYIIKGLKALKIDSEKIVIFISNIMTWAKTPNKYKTDSEDEIIFTHPEKEDIKTRNAKDKENESIKKENSFISNIKEQSKLYEQSFSNSIMGGMNQSKISIKQLQNRSKLSMIKEENKIIVYYTEKDYLKRKPALKYFEFKYIENEAINLNQKSNIKSYVICPGIVYGYGEKHFFSFFRSALLGLPIEEILLDKGRNIIPTIHMKDLVSIIAKVIEKKPASNYILAFDQTKNSSLKNIVKTIYNCMGDEKNMIEKKETLDNIEENKNENNENDIEKEKEKEGNKDIVVKEEKDENEESVKKEEQNEEGKLHEENENEENKPEENKPTVHPFFLNKKYQLSEFFPRDLLYLDVKILPSEFIKFEPKEKDTNKISKISTPLFKWHCPYGISSNPQSVKKEFLKYRNLYSNKILILGNPYTGKTTISQILSKIFHLPIVDIKSVVDFGKSFANIKLDNEPQEEKKENQNQEPINENNNEANNNELNENKEKIDTQRRTSEENDLIKEITDEINKLKENRAEAEEAYNKRPNKKKTDPPFDDSMYYRFSDELISKILKRRLEENDTSTYGFILDGVPKNYNQLLSLFNEGEKSIAFPNTILLFDDIEEDVCINRIKNSEEVLKDPKDPKVNIMIERANRRLAKIKEDKTKEDYKSIKDYFDEEENSILYKDKLMMIDGKNNTILDIIKSAQEFIIKNNGNKINAIDEGLYCNDYQYDYVKIEEEKNKPKEEENELNNEQNAQEEKDKDKDKEKENEIINENKEEINKDFIDKEKEKEEKKEIEGKKEETKVKSKLELEKENEFKLLEKKSEVLRRYLSENVLPLLSLGILHVANERPDDPVEALADYLLAKTFEIKKNEENNNEENNNEIEKEENKTIELNEDKNDDIKLELDLEKVDKIVEKKVGRLSPIHRENSENFNLDNNEKNEIEENNNKNVENVEKVENVENDEEDELNKAMIDSH